MHHYLEFTDEKSNKFWEITLDGKSFTVRYGKIGTDGQIQTKDFSSDDEAKKEAKKLLADKLKKGYVEKGASGKAAPAKDKVEKKKAPDAKEAKKPVAEAKAVKAEKPAKPDKQPSSAVVFTSEPFAIETKKIPPVWSALGNCFFNVCCLSPDGSILYEASHGSISLWNARTGEQTGFFPSGNDDHTKIIYDIAISSDGKLLATGSEDKSLVIWDVEKRQSIIKFKYKDFVESVAFSPDGKELYAGINEGSVRIIDLASMKEKKSIAFEELSEVKFVRFFPDGKRYAVIGDDHSVPWKDGKSSSWVYIVQSVDDHARLLTIPAPKEDEEVRSFALSPDGKHAALGIGRHFRLLDADTGYEIFSPEHGGNTSVGLSFAPDNKSYATIGLKGLVEIWKNGEPEALSRFETLDYGQDVSYTSDGSLMVTTMHHRTVYDAALNPVIKYEPNAHAGISALECGGVLLVCHADGKIRRWKSDTGELISVDEAPVAGKPFFSHDGSAYITIDGAPAIIDVMTRARREIPGAFGALTAAAFSPDAKRIALADTSCMVTILETDGFVKVGSFSVKPNKRERIVRSLCFSQDGKTIYADGFFKMTEYDCETGKETIGGFTDDISAIAVSKKYTIVGSCEGTVALWKTGGESEIKEFETFDGVIENVGLSADDQYFYCLYRTGLVRAFSTAKKKELFSFGFYADGEWLAVDSEGRFRGSSGSTKYLVVSDSINYLDFYADKKPEAGSAKKKKPKKQVIDVNLRYAILNVMKDFRFDRDAFHDENLGEEDEDHDCEYEPCPLIEKYLQSLDLSEYHPESVTEIDWSGGCDIQHQIWCYWDGECETFHIESLAGIGMLENLKSLNIGLSLITDLSPLASLQHLESLTLEQSPECGPVISLEPLLGIKTLKELSLGQIMVEDADRSNEIIAELIKRGVTVEAIIQG
jgi:WD40 repeat protein